MKQTYIRRSLSDWENLITAYEKSGQTQRDFCHTYNLSINTFQKWRQQIKNRREVAPSNGFKQIIMSQPETPPSVNLQTDTAWDIELELRGGMVLRIRGGAV